VVRLKKRPATDGRGRDLAAAAGPQRSKAAVVKKTSRRSSDPTHVGGEIEAAGRDAIKKQAELVMKRIRSAAPSTAAPAISSGGFRAYPAKPMCRPRIAA
jgi:hypothetical protein